MAWTNKGKEHALGYGFRGVTVPTNYYIALVTSANAPDADTNILDDLTEIAAGNGYTAGGLELTPGTTDFDVLTEDDTNDRGLVQVKDVVWTATGGALPSTGSGARYAVLVDDNTTLTNREVLAYWDLVSDRQVSDGQGLTLQNCELRLNES